MTCATRQPGRAVKPVLTPIPVSGPFVRVGVDIIYFSKSSSGNSSVCCSLCGLPYKMARVFFHLFTPIYYIMVCSLN